MILLVDDDPGVRFMLTLWLEELGLPFDEVGSGEEALERLLGRSYDVIVLDQRMPPGMDGVDLAKRLRSQGDPTPIVLHSAYLNPDVERQAGELGLPTVEKGDQARLLEAIRAAVGGRQ